eukprot:c16099_g1_i1.p1 GENE.c16099_g1_i1~~c16099_g1_i1.p1  ORF type:complete len:196 (-),score=44.76 c16099_g1_i1:25-588(-)
MDFHCSNILTRLDEIRSFHTDHPTSPFERSLVFLVNHQFPELLSTLAEAQLAGIATAGAEDPDERTKFLLTYLTQLLSAIHDVINLISAEASRFQVPVTESSSTSISQLQKEISDLEKIRSLSTHISGISFLDRVGDSLEKKKAELECVIVARRAREIFTKVKEILSEVEGLRGAVLQYIQRPLSVQ